MQSAIIAAFVVLLPTLVNKDVYIWMFSVH